MVSVALGDLGARDLAEGGSGGGRRGALRGLAVDSEDGAEVVWETGSPIMLARFSTVLFRRGGLSGMGGEEILASDPLLSETCETPFPSSPLFVFCCSEVCPFDWVDLLKPLLVALDPRSWGCDVVVVAVVVVLVDVAVVVVVVSDDDSDGVLTPSFHCSWAYWLLVGPDSATATVPLVVCLPAGPGFAEGAERGFLLGGAGLVGLTAAGGCFRPFNIASSLSPSLPRFTVDHLCIALDTAGGFEGGGAGDDDNGGVLVPFFIWLLEVARSPPPRRMLRSMLLILGVLNLFAVLAEKDRCGGLKVTAWVALVLLGELPRLCIPVVLPVGDAEVFLSKRSLPFSWGPLLPLLSRTGGGGLA